MKINIVKLGLTEYAHALAIQERLLQLRQNNETGDTLLLVEHPPVLTMGRRAKAENVIVSEQALSAIGVKVFEVSRGGDVTYHGPGQIVGYPIMDLNDHGRDIKVFVRKMEDVFIRLLDKEYGITAHREENKYTGVWVGEEKITAIGIAVKHWVTMHGFAFNVNTNLEHFRWINPCGITDRGVTSLKKLTGNAQDMDKLYDMVADYFCDVFNLEPVADEVEL